MFISILFFFKQLKMQLCCWPFDFKFLLRIYVKCGNQEKLIYKACTFPK